MPSWDEGWALAVLGHLNQARRRDQPGGQCEDLRRALDEVWNGVQLRPLVLEQRALLNRVQDRAVVSKLLVGFFDLLLDRPSTRLAVYGTLAPGEANAWVLSGVSGSWSKGRVRGIVGQRAGYPSFTFDPTGPDVAVDVFSSAELPDHFARIDAFEGREYVRVLVPVRAGATQYVANVYHGAW